jgi:hypothetical protein
MRQLLPGIVLYDEAGFRFIDRPGRREAAGDFIAASVVNNKPQINADDFSILQFIGSNLALQQRLCIEQKCCTRAHS